MSLSSATLSNYLNGVFNKLIKKKNNEIFINFKSYKKLNNDIKIALINDVIKKIKNNYYDVRSKKVKTLIKKLEEKDFKKLTLGGCIFFKKEGNLCLKDEKL